MDKKCIYLILFLGIVISGIYIYLDIKYTNSSYCLNCCGPPPCCSDCGISIQSLIVAINTDKVEYKQGEEVTIIIENKANCSISIDLGTSSYKPGINLEKQEDNFWKPYIGFSENKKCSMGGQGPAIGTIKINSGDVLERTELLVYEECINLSLIHI